LSGRSRPVEHGQTWSAAPAVVKGRLEPVVSQVDIGRESDHEELPPANGRRVGFLEAPDGVQIEVIEKA
jgi:hypothetical protein